jgi:hypothetical protein
MTNKSVRLNDFLTEQEIMLAAQMWRGQWLEDGKTFAQRVCDKIIKPNMQRINRALGQENDPMYLAYCVEYVLGLALHSKAFDERGT